MIIIAMAPIVVCQLRYTCLSSKAWTEHSIIPYKTEMHPLMCFSSGTKKRKGRRNTTHRPSPTDRHSFSDAQERYWRVIMGGNYSCSWQPRAMTERWRRQRKILFSWKWTKWWCSTLYSSHTNSWAPSLPFLSVAG